MVSANAGAGEAIFRRENCGRCHTLYGDPREGSPFMEWEPPPAGSLASRVGPDLGHEGHRRSDDWHSAHLLAPALVVPGSTMPASPHLFRPGPDGRPAPTRDAVDLVAFLQVLGLSSGDVWAARRSREPEIPPPPPADGALRARGNALYEARCAPCHGTSGDGRGQAADLLLFPPRDFVAAHYRFRSTLPGLPPKDEDLFRSVSLGTGTGSAMPGFSFLPATDRWALVLRVKEFSPALRGTGLRLSPGPPRGPEAGIEPGLIEEGRVLWRSLGCPACHGDRGTGLTREEANAAWADPAGVPIPRSGDLTHDCALRAGASGEAVERSIRFGVGLAMPAYGEALPGPRALAALRSFVLWLRTSQGS